MPLPPLGAEVVDAGPDLSGLPPLGGEVHEQPTFHTTNEKDASGEAVVDPNTLGTFASHAATAANPVAIGQMLPFPKAAGGSGWDNPLLPSNIAHAMHAVKQQGDAAWEKGDHLGAVTKYIEGVIPILGPMMSHQGDQLQHGKYMAALGDLVGMVGPMLTGKVVGKLGGAVDLTSTNPAEAAAVKFGQEQGIPVDAATATGNRFVKSAQGIVDNTLPGSFVAERARTATADAFKRVGGEIAEQVHPGTVTPEQAGEAAQSATAAVEQARADSFGKVADKVAARVHPEPVSPEQAGLGVKQSVQKMVGNLGNQADEAYHRLRTIEADPQFAQRVYTAPTGSQTERSILGKLAVGAENGQAPSTAEIAAMRQIEVELDSQPYKRGKLLETVDGEGHTVSQYDPRSGNAPVYHDIGQATGSMMTGREMLAGIRQTLETGDWNMASKGALEVARKRLLSSGALGGPRLPEGVPLLGTTREVNLPVDLTATKKALQPIYDRLSRDNSVVPLMGGKAEALRALDRLMNGPDVESLSVVDSALGDLKTMARADIPELRTQGQGVAAEAVKELDQVVQATARRAGPEAISALQEGRHATIEKYRVGDTLENIRQEPVQAYRQAVTPQDTGIEHLRKIQEVAPMDVPKVARAWFDDTIGKATVDGSFSLDKAKAIQSDWTKLGPETKKILFGNPATIRQLDDFFGYAAKAGQTPMAKLSGEPVTAFGQLVAPADSGINRLRAVQRYSPDTMPKVARGYLEDLFKQAETEGGFDKAQTIQTQWTKLGTETKKILFPKQGHAEALDHFFLLAKKMAEPANSSKTAMIKVAAGSMANVGLIFTSPTTMIPATVGAWAAAKLLHSPTVVRALTSGMATPLTSAVPRAVKAATYANIVKAADKVGVDLQALPASTEKPTDRPAMGDASQQIVRMVSPTGQEQDVPAAQVAHYEALGATRKR